MTREFRATPAQPRKSKVQDEGSPPAKSPWPQMFHDPANTSRILTTF